MPAGAFIPGCRRHHAAPCETQLTLDDCASQKKKRRQGPVFSACWPEQTPDADWTELRVWGFSQQILGLGATACCMRAVRAAMHLRGHLDCVLGPGLALSQDRCTIRGVWLFGARCSSGTAPHHMIRRMAGDGPHWEPSHSVSDWLQLTGVRTRAARSACARLQYIRRQLRRAAVRSWARSCTSSRGGNVPN